MWHVPEVACYPTGSETEDQVLEDAEPAGEAADVFCGGGAPVEVRREPGAW
jgi:hypothetical protein